jgi:hypothetical protein
MRGALEITYMDGTEDFFEVDPVGEHPDIVENLKAFLASPDVPLILDNEIVIIPSTSMHHQISISRSGSSLPEAELEAILGVVVGAKRIVG